MKILSKSNWGLVVYSVFFLLLLFFLINTLYFAQIRYLSPNSSFPLSVFRKLTVNYPVFLTYKKVFLPVALKIAPQKAKPLKRTFYTKPFILRGEGYDGLYIYEVIGHVGLVQEIFKNNRLYYYFYITTDSGKKLEFEFEREGLSIYHHPQDRSVPDTNPQFDDVFTIRTGDDLLVRYKASLESKGYNNPNVPYTEILEMYDYHQDYQ